MRHALLAIAALTLLVMASLPGCLQGPPGGGGPAAIDLRVEFGTYNPALHPGKVAEWTPDGHGNWSLALTNATDGRTVYIVSNVTARTALGALLAGAAAAGFQVKHHQESMGAFVDSVGGIENGRDGHYWSFYIDGTYGTVSSDRAGVSRGGVVRWVYLGSPVG
jgi:hypothetical protein